MHVSRIFALAPFFVLAACGTSQSSTSGASDTAAASAPVADLYSCSGSGVTISYATTSFTGEQTLNIAQGGLASLDSRGNQITAVKEGRVLSLTAAKYIPDFALLTWKIDLPVAFAGTDLNASAQLITNPTSISGPRPGQHQTVASYPVVCHASSVAF